ncbi:homoserine kinase [Vagococcus bubulae]|uniref:Homoserine kinase n=1 Tax=Vagococcus bubulae TaxID=1977868 RepID=A0A429ZG55_9ENTE|nr:homoserine kinase [Vagococcus bubulae]RST92698.1 homoserine kinase [Vagococcus bubulae]
MVHIQVPATSANVGVGFDTLGLAVTFYGECEVELSDKLEITGCPVAFQTEDNLIYQSYKYVLEKLNKPVTPIKLKIDSDIPFARGLGSSAVCIVSGVLAANELHELHLSESELVTYCTQLEGHPDNVVPALLGGLSASYQMGDTIFYQHYPVDESYQFVAFVPDFTLETAVARDVLPESYSLKTVVNNQAKLLFLLEALKTGDATNLDKFLDDDIHQPYRKKLIDEYDIVENIAKKSGAKGFYISGSGSTLMGVYNQSVNMEALNDSLKSLKHHWRALDLSVDYKGANVCHRTI